MESSPILDREEVLIGEESMDMKLLDSKFQENNMSVNSRGHVVPLESPSRVYPSISMTGEP